jgi:dolichyl-phosphate-mannose--protein O-mannosyl transferase
VTRKRRGVQGSPRTSGPPSRAASPRPGGGLLRQIRNAFLIFIAGLVFLTIRLEVPDGFVFDELSYIPAANGFATGVNLEPSHPPLAKLILAAAIQVWGDNSWGWRIAGAAAGAMILALVYVLTWQLSRDPLTSFAASLFTAVNGMLFVLARTGTLDAIAIMFLLAGFMCVVAVAQQKLSPLRGGALAGCAFGLCMACKWMALIPMAACWLALWACRKKAALPAILAMIAPFVAAYVVPFLILARLLHAAPTWSWFRAQQAAIYVGHAGYRGHNYIASHWWSWPLKMQPQLVRFNFGDNDAYVLLLGNPVVMWLGVAALLALAWRTWRRRDGVAAVICAAWIVLYGQYLVMPLQTEYYHYYLAASLCLGPALALVTRDRPWRMAALAAVAVWSFLCAYPAMAALPGGHWTRFFL